MVRALKQGLHFALRQFQWSPGSVVTAALTLVLAVGTNAAMLFGLCMRASAQQRIVSITVDDLPYVSHTRTALTPDDVEHAQQANRKLLAAFKKYRVPVTGFVNQGRVEGLGATAGLQILRQWITEGHDLGNHTYSHRDINELSVPQIEDEILRGETAVAPLMTHAGKRLQFFRFPMNHTGDTKAKHDEIAVFLAEHGYKLATCTIDNSDYLFNDAYVRTLAQKDEKTAKRLRREYLAYTSSEIDYYALLNKQVLGYEPPQVMLLHDNRLNADVINSLLEMFVRKRYKFVPLATASGCGIQYPRHFHYSEWLDVGLPLGEREECEGGWAA